MLNYPPILGSWPTTFTVISNVLLEELYFDKLGILSKLLAYIQIPLTERLPQPVEGYELGLSLR